MGKPAATLSHYHVCPASNGPVPHVGGPVIGTSSNVLIGGLPAATKGDKAVCVGPPDTITGGSSSVYINGKPAARMGDSTAHGGKIVIGNPTVTIGDAGVDSAPPAATAPNTGGESGEAPEKSTSDTENAFVRSGQAAGAKSTSETPERKYGGKTLPCGGQDATNCTVFKDPETAHKTAETWRNPRVEDGVAHPLEGTTGTPKKIPKSEEAGQSCSREFQDKTYWVNKDPDGFPEFTTLETYIDDTNINNPDEGAHFAEANGKVKQLLKSNPGLESELGLDKRQMKFFMSEPPKAKSPPGLTWHHHQDVGKMQLVDEQLHKRFSHVGGMEIWGGGRP